MISVERLSQKQAPLFRHLLCLFLGMSLTVPVLQPAHSQGTGILKQQVVELYRQKRYAEIIKLVLDQPADSEEKKLAKAKTLNRLVLMLYRQGRYEQALESAEEVLAANTESLGPEDPDVGTSLNNLALLYYSLADYTQAEGLFRRALAIHDKVLGPDDPAILTTLINLATLYQTTGNYSRAVEFYKRALAICEKYGPNFLPTAFVLNNLAAVYQDLADYPQAEELYKRALALRERTLGSDHPDVANTLNNLAALYEVSGSYSRAVEFYKRALAICEGALGPDHPHTAFVLNNLAGVYLKWGYYTQAEGLFRRALALRERVLGSDHPDVANTLNNLAALYEVSGSYSRAVEFYKRALAICEGALGPDHPKVVGILNNLGELYATLENYREAYLVMKKARHIEGHLIEQVLGLTNEEQKIKFVAAKRLALHAFLSLVVQHFSSDPQIVRDTLDIWLRRKGLILEVQKRFQEALVYSDDPEAVKTFQELAKVRARLSKLVFSGPGKEGPEAYKEAKASLMHRKKILEAKLSRLSKAFGVHRKIARADSGKVAAALPENSALLEFARINMFNHKAKELEPHYVAFVLHKGEGDKIGLIDLGGALKIDRLIARFKKEISTIPTMENQIELSRELYHLVFAPIRKELGKVREVFISPDGNLNLIPFEVLQGPDGRFLIEDYTFNYLAAGRDILGFGQTKAGSGKALIMGDPDFDLGGDERSSVLRDLGLAPIKDERAVRRSCEMKGLRFSRLPGTKDEAKAVYQLLGRANAKLYLGKEALEEVLRTNEAPRILHLATHGFFLKDLELYDRGKTMVHRGLQMAAIHPMPSPAGRMESPLLRSGIALAGANSALGSGNTGSCDGIVTAEEILGLRFRGTDMVVLSACNTGVGQVEMGEGVFGLRRAFSQAGAKSLVMSMWSVPDEETKELMIHFYKNVLSGRMNRCQALRQAALKQMETVRRRYGWGNPLYWGGFVFMGEP